MIFYSFLTFVQLILVAAAFLRRSEEREHSRREFLLRHQNWVLWNGVINSLLSARWRHYVFRHLGISIDSAPVCWSTFTKLLYFNISHDHTIIYLLFFYLHWVSHRADHYIWCAYALSHPFVIQPASPIFLVPKYLLNLARTRMVGTIADWQRRIWLYAIVLAPSYHYRVLTLTRAGQTWLLGARLLSPWIPSLLSNFPCILHVYAWADAWFLDASLSLHVHFGTNTWLLCNFLLWCCRSRCLLERFIRHSLYWFSLSLAHELLAVPVATWTTLILPKEFTKFQRCGLLMERLI